MEKVSFICTVLNEEKTVGELLRSLSSQTKKPDEVIIVDGGSSDSTKSTILNLKSYFLNQNSKFKVLTKKGNRSVGRNYAIDNAKGDIIVISDAGCVLEKDWIKNIIKPFTDKNADVVAGYYRGVGKTVLQKSMIPYFLVMADRVDPHSFLPATRSMAIRKKVWEELSGFNEKLSLNEDFEFAKRLKKHNKNIQFVKNAIVYWSPPKDIMSFYTTIFRFARGDIQSKILRPKVILLFSRYLILFQLLVMLFATRELIIAGFLCLVAIWYVFFSISKNYMYVKNMRVVFYLPLLQFVADFAVINGTIRGTADLWDIQKQL